MRLIHSLFIFFMVLGMGASLAWVPATFAQAPASGNQLDFRLGYRGHTMAYHYKWLDHTRSPQTMSFELNRNMVKEAAHEFQPFDNTAVNEFVLTAVKTYASNLQAKGIDMQVTEDRNTGKMVVKAAGALPRDMLQAEMDTVSDLVLKARASYIKNKMFRQFDETHIVPDHARIASLNYRRMTPVARAVAGKTVGYDFRERINFVLSFLQAIPYDELMDRKNSNGSGFATPVELITRNIADCDSKSVAFASIVRNIYPRTPMVLVLVPGHAFVGIATAQGPDDFALRLGGTTYVLAEPVGPGLLPLGRLDKRSEVLLRRKDYTYVNFN